MGSAAKRRVPVKRRSNEQRTAEMRGRLIDAAIDTLYQSGYSATTTIEVAKRARVSRGAMLHHFPTRADLLLAAAQFIADSDRRFRQERLFAGDIAPGLERFYAAGEVSWELHRRPSTIALLEIMMATRSDPSLGKAFAPFLAQRMQAARNSAAKMAADLGVKDIAQIANMIRLHQASMRGLAIELMFSHDAQEVENARLLQAHFDRSFVEKLVADTKRKRPGR
jgi:AcrR family transcriptional regulator